jgi:U3 small nucleolar RNA-associated protein 12
MLSEEETLCKEVTQVACSPDKTTLAVGYADGSIRLWNLQQQKRVVTLNGHNRAISALRFNSTGSMLASGSKDTVALVWDVINETGICK